MKKPLIFVFILLLESCALSPQDDSLVQLDDPALNGWQQIGKGKWQ